MQSQKNIENKLKELKPILSTGFFVKKIGYFGSYSRDEQNEFSDIDIIVTFAKPIGWEFFDLQEFLESELNLKVDLVSDKAIKEQLKQIILKSVKYV